jgi:hypothetical protein
MQIKADFKEIKKLENFLDKFNRTGIKYATRNTLNTLAFDVRKQAQGFIQDNFINRNKWTVNSVQVNMAKGFNIDNMQSEVGSTQGYMEMQEVGGRAKPKTGKNLPIPTQSARIANQKNRLVSRANALKNIILRDKQKLAFIANKRQRAIGIIENAKRNNYKHFYLDLGNVKGIFTLKNDKLRMIYSLQYLFRKIPATHWLSKSSDKVANNALDIYNMQLKKQIDRIIF